MSDAHYLMFGHIVTQKHFMCFMNQTAYVKQQNEATMHQIYLVVEKFNEEIQIL